ncbi:hypothetical protein SAMN05444396_105270 [Flavobacterium segetis]|uniref:Uncharacterized protein n=1 Tax=Flavobacterium segetis TaxID=271157 RepID=A0A1M5HRG2_9FLAO|nr:hypothetical protein [Flavobacterium segetis]SHG18549.1 hypothetical protein SAMN05444396_105270 [Flavobacterium segetis]
MFLNYIKDFILKKTLKNGLINLENNFSSVAIKKVGLLIDSASFFEKEKLISDIVLSGILVENISAIVCTDKITNIDHPKFISFMPSQLSWDGTISNDEINAFIAAKFDLLINYYDIEKAILLQITHQSNALFKVGFTTVDKRLNHFMITTAIENHSVFIRELFKYLKLLKKI